MEQVFFSVINVALMTPYIIVIDDCVPSLHTMCVTLKSVLYIYIVNDASSDSHIVVKRNISVVTRQLLLYLCYVICVMTSHPRSLLAQLVCICVCIDVSRVNGC